MRKYVGMVLALICIVTLTACGSDKKITLPELEKITEIEIIKNTSERGKKVTGKEEISKIISELKDNSESTKKKVLAMNLQIQKIIFALNFIMIMQMTVQV